MYQHLSDEEVLDELLRIPYGLTENDELWIDLLTAAWNERGFFYPQERNAACNILGWWKDRYG